MNNPSSLTTINPELLSISPEQMSALGPWAWVLGAAILAMLAAVVFRSAPKWPVALLSMAGFAGGAISAVQQLGSGDVSLFNRMMLVDGFSLLFVLICCVAGLVTVVASLQYLDREALQHPEYYILLLFAAFGMMMMGAAMDLIVVFIALEIMSLAVYVLVGFRRSDRRSNEAAMKYFVLGSAASAVFLYGAALLYGATGSLNISTALSASPSGIPALLAIGGGLLVFGFLFKVAAVPFHMWMPDVYEGAPTPITGFMTTGIKAASFAAFVRILVHLGFSQDALHDLIWWVAALTMLVGNAIALTQVNLKRMLAYSSIAHTGYLLVGLLAGPGTSAGYGPVFMYLLAYTITNLGAFALLGAVGRKADLGTNLHDLAGLSRKHPWLALAMSVFLFSMAGIPPTAGFAAKYLMLSSAVQAGEISITVIAVLCSAISVYYYLRVLVFMYMREPASTGPVVSGRSFGAALSVALMVILVLGMGILPAPVMEMSKRAALVSPPQATAAR